MKTAREQDSGPDCTPFGSHRLFCLRPGAMRLASLPTQCEQSLSKTLGTPGRMHNHLPDVPCAISLSGRLQFFCEGIIIIEMMIVVTDPVLDPDPRFLNEIHDFSPPVSYGVQPLYHIRGSVTSRGRQIQLTQGTFWG